MMQHTKSISLLHYRKAGELAQYLRSRCEAGEWEGLSMADLCKRFAASKTVLSRAFKQRFATTIHAYIINEKMAYAKRLLLTTSFCVKDIALMAGYYRLSNFSRDFTRREKFSPIAYRIHHVGRSPADIAFLFHNS